MSGSFSAARTVAVSLDKIATFMDDIVAKLAANEITLLIFFFIGTLLFFQRLIYGSRLAHQG
jgi:hypothetical protein